MGPKQGCGERSKAQFSEAFAVFEDEHAITITDDLSDPSEERFLTLGTGIKGRVLAVAWSYRSSNVRIISARKASSSERKQYEAQP